MASTRERVRAARLGDLASTTLALLERGYAERMLISADSCATLTGSRTRRSRCRCARGGEGLDDQAWSPNKVLPTLREGGMTDEQVTTVLQENPKRWLAC